MSREGALSPRVASHRALRATTKIAHVLAHARDEAEAISFG
jgi:hypothetical protein